MILIRPMPISMALKPMYSTRLPLNAGPGMLNQTYSNIEEIFDTSTKHSFVDSLIFIFMQPNPVSAWSFSEV